MTKTFLHSFAPSPASPITGAAVDLDVADIEVAGIREVCQGPEQEQSEIDGMEGSRSPGARMASVRMDKLGAFEWRRSLLLASI
ncbi:hypothetical protein At1D1460_51100 (plasmid) [Agrobacterium tumefaciens]|nr:hypothetical protein At1D1460_51100 [Agrobacterium tumefaciens]